jgi:general secretion pathway protein I
MISQRLRAGPTDPPFTPAPRKCARNPPRRACGFSLLELLVAFMVLTLALTVIFRIVAGSLRNIRVAGEYAQALEHAEDRLAAVGVGERLRAGERAGHWPDGYRWREIVEEYRPWPQDQSGPGEPTAHSVRVEVSWGDTGNPRWLSLTTLRVQGLEQDR